MSLFSRFADVADVTLRGPGSGVASRGLAANAVSDNLLKRDTAVLLIHGYNVSEPRAVRECSSFRDGLSYYQPALREKTFVCTWAGNWNSWGLRGLAYPFMVRGAIKSGITLYQA